MPDQPLPPNPFQRVPEPQDPRSSKLFAHQQPQQPSSPYGERVQTPTQSQMHRPPQRTAPPKISARRELRLHNIKLRRNILIGISVFIGLLLALIATDTLKLGTGPQPYFSDASASPAQTSATTKVEGEQVESIRTPTAKDPLRVYIGGDSLVGSIGNPLATQLGNLGVIKATYDSRPSSGLVNSDFFNWNTHAKSILTQYKPEVVVFMIGTNDAAIVSSNPKGYKEAYSEKLNDFLDIVSPSTRKVFFVLAPSMKETALNKNVDKINDVISDVAKEWKVHVLDSSSTLSPSGTFSIKVSQGNKNVVVRADDGVHITGEGGKLLATSIFKSLDKLYSLSQFKVTPAIKPVKVPGCCTSPTSIPSGTFSTASSSTTSSTSTSSPSTSSTSTTAPEVSSPPAALTPAIPNP